MRNLTTQRLLSLAILAGLNLTPLLAQKDGDDHNADAILPIPNLTATTVPSNGVVFVPAGFPAGSAAGPGDLLVSNFNNSNNLQGTGTTIVRIPATGTPPNPDRKSTRLNSSHVAISYA